MKTEAVPQRATKKMLRACLLKAEAYALGYPTPDRFGVLKASLDVCMKERDLLALSIREKLPAFAIPLLKMSRDEYEVEYVRVLTHVCAADCNPSETSYMAKHIFQLSQQMASLTGFYQAFGLEPTGERADHIAVEMEFLGFLSFREALEYAEGHFSNANNMKEGQRLFLDRHLAKWAPTFLTLLRRKAGPGLITNLADLISATLRVEARTHKVKLKKFSPDMCQLSPLTEIAPSPLTLATGSFAEGVFCER